MRVIILLMILVTSLVAHEASAQDAALEIAAVKAVVDATTAASNAQKLEELLALFADDAKIDSKAAGRQVSKDQYREAMKTLFDRRALSKVDVEGMRVSLLDASHATVDGTVSIQLASGNRTGGKNQWKLEKRDGRWLIVETKYQ